MKEQIDTIPVNDAFSSEDECPFCWLERKAEQSTIRYVVGPGASYMEPDVREVTDAVGFCTGHMQALYDYGNTLGSALILQTHYAALLKELEAGLEDLQIPKKAGLFAKKQPAPQETWWQHLAQKRNACFICDRLDYHRKRYFHTFFVMLKDPEFRDKVAASKGFCLHHFTQLMDAAQSELPKNQQQWFYDTIPAITRQNLIRVKEDLDWLIAKYDYRNAGAPWKNAKDALPRAMEKVQGFHPADPPYKNE